MTTNAAAPQPSRRRMREMFSPATLLRGGSLKSPAHAVRHDSEPLTPDQVIDEASMDSFPASDPPSWAAGPAEDFDSEEKS